MSDMVFEPYPDEAAEEFEAAEKKIELLTAEVERLSALLTYGEPPLAQEPTGEFFLVTPRLGTLSPWASKATDIARHCGLENVLRIERGIAAGLADVAEGRVTQMTDEAIEQRLARFRTRHPDA